MVLEGSKVTIEDLMEEIKPVVSERFDFEKWDKYKLIAFLELSDNQKIDIWTKTIGFQVKISGTIVKCSIEALMKEVNLVDAGKKSSIIEILNVESLELSKIT